MCVALPLLLRIWSSSLAVSGMYTCPCNRPPMRKGFDTWARWKLMSGTAHPKRREATRCGSTWATPAPQFWPSRRTLPPVLNQSLIQGAVGITLPWEAYGQPERSAQAGERLPGRGAARRCGPKRSAPRRLLESDSVLGRAREGAGDCRCRRRPYLAATARARPPLGRHGAGGAAPLPPPGPAQGAPRWRHSPAPVPPALPGQCARPLPARRSGPGAERFRQRPGRAGAAPAAPGARPSRPATGAAPSCATGERRARNTGRHAPVTTTQAFGGHILGKNTS